MKIVQINATCGVGSTGKICEGISKVLVDDSIENYILYSSKTNGYKLGLPCSSDKEIKLQALKSKILGNYGFNSYAATKRIINELSRIQPDIVHLHNIHGHDCNLKILFKYFRENQTKLVWTFHDCWAFTGYCPHFTMIRCDKWKTQCGQCVQRHEHSFFFDKSRELYEKKKQLLSGLNLTVVTPSRWMAKVTGESFMSRYPICVVNNGIDLNVFNPVDSDFREKYNLREKKIVLGVSFGWGERKGLDVFVDLAKKLPDQYKIILVGTDEVVDKTLPRNILSIHRTQNQRELAKIYSAADVFVNPTREENYPTVNMESLACGTPVITFCTGGSPEIIDETCGSVIPCDDVNALEQEILRVCTDSPYSERSCLKKAKRFDQGERFKEYLTIYKRIDNEGEWILKEQSPVHSPYDI